MICGTTLLRAKPGREKAIREALLDLADLTRSTEPGTLDLVITQDAHDPGLFSVCVCFADEAALNEHNNSDPMTRFLFFARDMLDGPMSRVSGPTLFAKREG
jgi:quinol monooxygenase YgiN